MRLSAAKRRKASAMAGPRRYARPTPRRPLATEAGAATCSGSTRRARATPSGCRMIGKVQAALTTALMADRRRRSRERLAAPKQSTDPDPAAGCHSSECLQTSFRSSIAARNSAVRWLGASSLGGRRHPPWLRRMPLVHAERVRTLRRYPSFRAKAHDQRGGRRDARISRALSEGSVAHCLGMLARRDAPCLSDNRDECRQETMSEP